MRAVLALVLLFAAAGCTREPPLHKQQAYVFGTLVEVSVASAPPETAQAALAAVLARFDALHRQLHAWEDSELSRLNAALARSEPVTVSPALATLLADARAYALASEGRFDPAIGRLVALWGFHGTPRTQPPTSVEIDALVRAAPRMADLVIDGTTVSSPNPALQIDLGGYAKGHALDEAAQILRARGIEHALVNIGGNVLALGRAGHRPWRVGIQHPREAGTLAVVELADGEAIGTSGDYQRYFESNGVRYSHLIDPATGRPAHGMQSVTVLVSGAHAGTRSDVLSKPLFIAGSAALPEVAARLGITHWLAVDADGEVTLSAAMRARLR